MGWIKRPSEKKKKEAEEEEEEKFYDIWDKKEDENRRLRYHIPAPKLKLPGMYYPASILIAAIVRMCSFEGRRMGRRKRGRIKKKKKGSRCNAIHFPDDSAAFAGHEESYNPPPEYLFTEEEEMAWKDKDKEDRRINFIPKGHECMRKVNPYDK